jgi:predicted alpha/beta hydrolase
MTEDITQTTIRFAATDGWELEADIHTSPSPKIAVLISAGTGFPRQFYTGLAMYLARQGAVVLTYDYRGIGGSNGKDLAGSGIDYPDWGRLDAPAALNTLEEAAPGLPLTHLCHSVGGHFVGLMPNQSKITRHAFVSVGTGFFGGHHLRNIPSELYFWWVLGPYLLLRYGYIKPAGGWRGEALPPKLFKTWRRWSQRRSYFQPDLATKLAPHHYDEVTAPIRSWIFPDDPIATPSTASDLLKCYPAAPHEVIIRKPSQVGVTRIGHEGALRKGRDALWAEFSDWLMGAP